MLRALYTAASGMTSQQFNVDTISHNLANVNTTAFKKTRPEFQDLLYLTIKRPLADQEGTGAPSGCQVGLGVRTAGTHTFFQQGNLKQTDNPLDFAISGPGFFAVQNGQQEHYTRDGGFKLEAGEDGIFLVNSSGCRVLDEDGDEIEIPENFSEIIVAADGKISYKVPDEDELEEGPRIKIVQFAYPAGLEKLGQNLYWATVASGEPEVVDEDLAGNTISVQQKYLEEANVQVVEEMVALITAQRAYEINSKAIQAADEMLGIVNNLKR